MRYPSEGSRTTLRCVFLSTQESGRELARDIKRKALKRKRTRIEEKLDKAKEKVSFEPAVLGV